MARRTFKPEIVYETENEESGVLAQVITVPIIKYPWLYKVILHDIDAGELVPVSKSFKNLVDAEAYADNCTKYA